MSDDDAGRAMRGCGVAWRMSGALRQESMRRPNEWATSDGDHRRRRPSTRRIGRRPPTPPQHRRTRGPQRSPARRRRLNNKGRNAATSPAPSLRARSQTTAHLPILWAAPHSVQQQQSRSCCCSPQLSLPSVVMANSAAAGAAGEPEAASSPPKRRRNCVPPSPPDSGRVWRSIHPLHSIAAAIAHHLSASPLSPETAPTFTLSSELIPRTRARLTFAEAQLNSDENGQARRCSWGRFVG